jgi:hypothetical protein
LAYSIRLKSIAASISCLLSAYSVQLQAGGDFDHEFDPSVDPVAVVSLWRVLVVLLAVDATLSHQQRNDPMDGGLRC